MGITPIMAIIDFIPVVIFLVAAIIMQRDLYYRLPKGAYTIMAGGMIMAFIGGLFKALWKILYGFGICDYVLLNHSFFPLQGPGFLLFFLGMCGIFYKDNKNKVNSTTIPLITATMPFIIMQIVGLGGSQFILGAIALKKKNYKGVFFCVLAFICMLGMGYLGAKFDDSSNMHWIAQFTNICSMTFFLLATLAVRKTNYND